VVSGTTSLTRVRQVVPLTSTLSLAALYQYSLRGVTHQYFVTSSALSIFFINIRWVVPVTVLCG